MTSALKKFTDQIVLVLPQSQSLAMRQHAASAGLSHVEDVSVQAVYLDAHLDKVHAAESCNVKFACAESFGFECDAYFNMNQYKMLRDTMVSASIGTNKWYKTAEKNQKCNVKNFLQELSKKATEAGDVNSRIGQCEPLTN